MKPKVFTQRQRDEMLDKVKQEYGMYYGYDYYGGCWQYRSNETIDYDHCLLCDNEGKYRLFNFLDFRICSLPYDDILPISECGGYYRAKKDDLWGIIDSEGKEMFPPTFQNLGAEMFCNQFGPYLISAFDGAAWGYINLYGVIKIPFKYHSASAFRHDHLWMRQLIRNSDPAAIVSFSDSNPITGEEIFHEYLINTHGEIIKYLTTL